MTLADKTLGKEDKQAIRYSTLLVFNKHNVFDDTGTLDKDLKKKCIKQAKERAKAVMYARCRAKGMNSIITMILVGIAVRLAVAFILAWIKKWREDRQSPNALYQSWEPGYME